MGRSLLKGMLMGSAASVALLSVVSVSMPPPVPAGRDVATVAPPEQTVAEAPTVVEEAPAPSASGDATDQPELPTSTEGVDAPAGTEPDARQSERDIATEDAPESPEALASVGPEETELADPLSSANEDKGVESAELGEPDTSNSDTRGIPQSVARAPGAGATEPSTLPDVDPEEEDTVAFTEAPASETMEPAATGSDATEAIDAAEDIDAAPTPVQPASVSEEVAADVPSAITAQGVEATETVSVDAQPADVGTTVAIEEVTPEAVQPERVALATQTGATTSPIVGAESSDDAVARESAVEEAAVEEAVSALEATGSEAPTVETPNEAAATARDADIAQNAEATTPEPTQVLAMQVLPRDEVVPEPARPALAEAARAAPIAAPAIVAIGRVDAAAPTLDERPERPIPVALVPERRPPADVADSGWTDTALSPEDGSARDATRAAAPALSGASLAMRATETATRVAPDVTLSRSAPSEAVSGTETGRRAVSPAPTDAGPAPSSGKSSAVAALTLQGRPSLQRVTTDDTLPLTEYAPVPSTPEPLLASSLLRPAPAGVASAPRTQSRLRGTILPTPPGLRAMRPAEVTLAQAQPEAAPATPRASGVGSRVVPLTERGGSTVRVNRPGIAESDADTVPGTGPAGMTSPAPSAQLPGQGARRIVVGAPPPEAATQGEATAESASAEPALQRNAVPFEAPTGTAGLLAVILLDPAEDPATSDAVAALGIPLAAAITPGGPAAPEAAARYGNAGKEVLLAGAGLPEGATPQDAEVALSVHLQSLPNAIGLMAPEAGGFTSDRDVADQVLQILAADGHGLVLWDKGLNPVRILAERSGRPTGLIYRQIDSRSANAREIQRRLDRAAFEARREGGVIVVGTARPETLEALMIWSERNRTGDVALAPVSALLGRP